MKEERHEACFKIIPVFELLSWTRTQLGGPSLTVMVAGSLPMCPGRAHEISISVFESMRRKCYVAMLRMYGSHLEGCIVKMKNHLINGGRLNKSTVHL